MRCPTASCPGAYVEGLGRDGTYLTLNVALEELMYQHLFHSKVAMYFRVFTDLHFRPFLRRNREKQKAESAAAESELEQPLADVSETETLIEDVTVPTDPANIFSNVTGIRNPHCANCS